MKPLCVLVTGDTVDRARRRGEFFQLIREATGDAWPGPWRSADVRAGEAPPRVDEVAGLVVSGSPASVARPEPWMRPVEEHLRAAARAGTPTLGICFGHQLLAVALGGRAGPSPHGREMGTVELEVLHADPLLDEGPPPLLVNETHLDAVLELPAGARAIGRTAHDPHAAARFDERVWGVQFHPEIDGDVMRLYLEARRDVLEAEGADPDALLAAARDARAGTAVLPRFARIVLDG